MTTIEHHGIEFYFADADGELLDATLVDRDEFLAHHADEWDANDLPAPTGKQIIAWAEEHLADDAWEHSGARATWSLDRRYGVDNSDFYSGRR